MPHLTVISTTHQGRVELTLPASRALAYLKRLRKTHAFELDRRDRHWRGMRYGIKPFLDIEIRNE